LRGTLTGLKKSTNTETGKDILDVYNPSTDELLGGYSGVFDVTQQVRMNYICTFLILIILNS